MSGTTGAADSGEEPDALASRDHVVCEIRDEIEQRGYYLAHVDPLPAQALIDLRWAGQAAGRALGRQVRTFASAAGARQPGKISVVVVPVDASAAGDTWLSGPGRSVVEHVVGRQSDLSVRRSLSA
jgi:hypothetical protein